MLKDKNLFMISRTAETMAERIKAVQSIEDQEIIKFLAKSAKGHQLVIQKEAIKRVTDREFLKDLCEKHRSERDGISFDCFDRLQELTNSVMFVLD